MRLQMIMPRLLSRKKTIESATPKGSVAKNGSVVFRRDRLDKHSLHTGVKRELSGKLYNLTEASELKME